MTETYTPPKVWTWDAENGGEWAKLNRPIAGATHDKDLPVGEHPLQLYSLATPNGVKVTVMLEELLAAGHAAEYDAWLIKIQDGDQFGSGFVDVNPNSKIPALMDHDTGSRVFESGAILMYLAEKYGAFLPASGPARTETLNWLFWLQGSAPYLGGGFGHFFAYAPEKFEYPINRFTMEAKRQLDVLNRRLGESKYLGGDDYSIADIATAPWYGRAIQDKGYPGAGDFLAVHEYTNIIRWMDDVSSRRAYQRGAIVNKSWGEGEPQLAERHRATDIDTALKG
ncbi:MAG: glutathione-dependent disulfide-bond oxidoreductase [Yoonia sp.]|nr:glutathione-dependent disulfide-bond oxidoreductase [Yoonia sp.]